MCVVEWKVSSRLMWVGVEIDWEFMPAYGPSSDNSEEGFWNELSDCVGSFGSAWGFKRQSGKCSD